VLEYAHRQGIVHRDIKQDNIYLAQGNAMMAELGIARAMHAADTPGRAAYVS
jgi:serine/threonine-protein kinase